jgi:CrcB protein
MTRLPPIRGRVVAAVAVGGLVGGALRYAVGLWVPTSPTGFPWAVFAVNTAGAFVLALLLVLVLEVLPPTTYLRPLIGTGFCGALTTFSSVVTGADQLVARGSGGLAAGYLAASLAAGLTAVVTGIALARRAAAGRAARR